eukprot:2428266-Pyramimonas_sp.AAC.1
MTARREPIGGGTGGYTRGGNRSEEGHEDIPGVGTNRRRDGHVKRTSSDDQPRCSYVSLEPAVRF